MASIVFACVSPHPPIIVPEIGQGRERGTQSTIAALQQVAAEIARYRPETAILISPHGPAHPDAFAILVGPRADGSLEAWDAPQVTFAFENDQEAASLIRDEAQRAAVPLAPLERWRHRDSAGRWCDGLDWGCTVPLYYLRPGLADAKLVPLCVSFLSPPDHFALGQAVGRAAERLGKRVAIIASADLSHNLAYGPMGPLFDERIQQAIAEWDVEAVLNMDARFRQQAAEDAVPSLSFLMGALDGLAVKPRVFSYEGPFGVGYLVAAIDIEGPTGPAEAPAKAETEAVSHPLVRLAKEAVETFVRQQRIIEPRELSEEMRQQAGAFVSIKKRGELRGCIGTIEPTQANLALEIVRNAIDSATRDPRFLPVTPDELPELSYSVDVLSPPEPVSGPEELNPQRYGVIVRLGPRRGLLLPDLEGVNTVEEQIAIAKSKAGILPEESAELYRFSVKRYK
ncbi:MAG: AmmeMemoRadiSam system protein A [Dehalococcoidia bacterium]